MAKLLELPIEVRLMIFKLVVLYEERSPPTERREGNNRIPLQSRRRGRGWISNEVICEPYDVLCDADSSHYLSNAGRLIRTCQQFKADVKSLLASKGMDTLSGNLIYKLDLTIMQGADLWPTWTFIPMKATVIDQLQVKIHVAGPGPPCHAIFNDMPMVCGTQRYEWWLYSMLERFLTYGPESPGHASQDVEGAGDPEAIPGQKLAIRTLDLDFIDNDPLPFRFEHAHTLTFSPGDMKYRGGGECAHCGLNCHLRVARALDNKIRLTTGVLLSWSLSNILHMLTDSLTLYWSEIFYRGVETLRFSLRGVPKAEFNLARLLAGMPPRAGRHDRNEVINDIIATRYKFGLECFERRPFDTHMEWQHNDETVIAYIEAAYDCANFLDYN